MTDLTDLIARIEQADGPSRELDVETDTLLGWSQLPNPTSAGGLYGMMVGPDGQVLRRNVPAYTASLDAAMTLVPEGWVSGSENWPDPSGNHARAWVKGTSVTRMGRKEYWGHASSAPHIEATAATPALALCAAALKARQ